MKLRYGGFVASCLLLSGCSTERRMLQGPDGGLRRLEGRSGEGRQVETPGHDRLRGVRRTAEGRALQDLEQHRDRSGERVEGVRIRENHLELGASGPRKRHQGIQVLLGRGQVHELPGAARRREPPIRQRVRDLQVKRAAHSEPVSLTLESTLESPCWNRRSRRRRRPRRRSAEAVPHRRSRRTGGIDAAEVQADRPERR